MKQELSDAVIGNLSKSTSLNDISSQEEDGILNDTTMIDGMDSSSGSQSGQYVYVYILCGYVYVYAIVWKNFGVKYILLKVPPDEN